MEKHAGPCHRGSLAWWPSRRGWLLCEPAQERKHSQGWSCHRASALWDVLARMSSGASSGRLCSAAGRCERCQGALQGRLPPGQPGKYLLSCRQGSCVLSPVICSSCGAPGEWHCSSKPSFAPEANWDESKGLSGFLSRFPPCLVGLITPKGVRVNYSSGFGRSEKSLCHHCWNL